MSEDSYLFYQNRNPRPFLSHGEGIYLFDESGKRYIDGSSGAMVSNIGHSNPRVLEKKMKAQIDKATFGYRLHFRTHPSEDLAAKTVAMTPDGLDRIFFVSGGSEAVESAMKLARQYALTQGEAFRHKMNSRFPSYHGCTFGALDLTGYEPLGAIVAGKKIVEPVLDAGGFLHDFIYAGNPLACSAGLAVLEEMEEQGLIENAARMEEVLMEELHALMDRYPFIGDVRGKGLLTAFEFVPNRETMEPLPPKMDAHAHLVVLAYERGLIIYSLRTHSGTAGDHFLIAPPLIITVEQIAEVLTILCDALDAFANETGLPVLEEAA